MVRTTTATAAAAAAAAAATTGFAAGGRVPEERGQREGEGPDAGAEQGVRSAQDDVAVGAGRHQAVQVGHAPVGHYVHRAPELVARSIRAVDGRRRSGRDYHDPGSGRRIESAELRRGNYTTVMTCFNDLTIIAASHLYALYFTFNGFRFFV